MLFTLFSVIYPLIFSILPAVFLYCSIFIFSVPEPSSEEYKRLQNADVKFRELHQGKRKKRKVQQGNYKCALFAITINVYNINHWKVLKNLAGNINCLAVHLKLLLY